MDTTLSRLQLTFKIHSSMDEIASDAWDAIFPSYLESYSFRKIIEQSFSKDYSFFYITFYDGERLIAIIPSFVTRYALDTTINGPLKTLAKRVQRLWPHFMTLRTLIIGSPVGEGSIGMKKGYEGSLEHLISEAIEVLALREEIKTVAFKDFKHTQSQFFDVLKQKGFHKRRSFPAVELKIPFQSFDDYMTSLKGSTRRSLKEKFKKTEDLPITLVVRTCLGPWLDDAYALYQQTIERSTVQFEIAPKEFFACANGTQTKFFLWFLNGKLVAFHCCFMCEGTLTDKYIGLDYSLAYDYHLYFLSFRDIIQWCIDQGVRTFDGGALCYEPKKRLKFSFVPQYVYCKHANPLFNICLRALSALLKPEHFDPVLRLIYSRPAFIQN